MYAKIYGVGIERLRCKNYPNDNREGQQIRTQVQTKELGTNRRKREGSVCIFSMASIFHGCVHIMNIVPRLCCHRKNLRFCCFQKFQFMCHTNKIKWQLHRTYEWFEIQLAIEHVFQVGPLCRFSDGVISENSADDFQGCYD